MERGRLLLFKLADEEPEGRDYAPKNPDKGASLRALYEEGAKDVSDGEPPQ